MTILPGDWAAAGGALATAVAAGSGVYVALLPGGLLRVVWDRYRAEIARRMPPGPRAITGQRLAVLQLLLVAAAVAGSWVTDLPLALPAVLLLGLPHLVLERRHRARIDRLARQLPAFLVSFAAALRVVPHPTAALESVRPTVSVPLRDELSQLLRELRLGVGLDEGLHALRDRLRAGAFTLAVTGILIARRSGGDLPRVLETTAETLREGARLDGMARSRTSEARAQMAVLLGCPFVIVAGLHALSPGYFDPLGASWWGWAVVGGAVLSWLSALLVARAVLGTGG